MKKARIGRIILSSIVSIIFLLAAYSKFSSAPAEIVMLEKIHLLDYRVALGCIDIILALSLWNKKTRSIGVLIGSAYLGAAIASELSLGGTGVIPGILLLMLWGIHKIDLRKNCSCGVCDDCIVKVASLQK